MARNFTSSQLAQIQAAAKRPVLFFEAQYTGGFIRVWSGIGPLAWNGQTWTGLGDLLSVSPIIEATDTVAQGFKVSLSGVPSAIVAENIGQVQRGYSGKVWLGFFDSSNTVIADPYLAAAGQLDQPEMDESAAAPMVTVSYENRLISLERARERRFDSEDQQIDYPGDLGFAYVASLQEWDGGWGIPGPAVQAIIPDTGAGGGGGGEATA